KEARQTHLSCVMEKTKYKKYQVGEQSYTGGQLFAREYDGSGYILKGKEFDKMRSKIAVEDCAGESIKVGGLMTSVSQLFGYEFDKKIYEDDRRHYANVFYEKLKHYFEYIGHRAGVPVVFNAMIYLIVDVTMQPEPAVYMLDPHDMQFQGKKFKDKKKLVPLQYILGSPTGATLFFPPNDEETKIRLKKELTDPELVLESRIKFIHLLELALFNKETYLKQLVKNSIGNPPKGLEEFFRMLEIYAENVFYNAIKEELCKVFMTSEDSLEDVLDFIVNQSFSIETLTDELTHHFPEFTREHHLQFLQDLFKMKKVFISLPSFIREIMYGALPTKDEKLWSICIAVGKYIDINRIKGGLGPTTRNPLTQQELEYYTYIFKGLLFLFNSPDRYSHVEAVEEFLGTINDLENYYILAAVGEGLVKGNRFRNSVWVGIVEYYLNILAEKLHGIIKGSVLLDMSIDRFLKKLEKGELKVKEDLLEDIANAFNDACHSLRLPLDGVLWMVDQLKNRMKKTNIIKRQILVAISANIGKYADLKERLEKHVTTDFPVKKFSFHETRDMLIDISSKMREIAVEGEYERKHLYMLAEGELFRDPTKVNEWEKAIKVIDELRISFATDMNGLHEIITNNIGTIASIDSIRNLVIFNDFFRLEGSKESEFASKINVVYNEKYETLRFEDIEENLSPLIIRNSTSSS
ncbi:MAG: hypothetical protein ACTSXU_02635, partial [Promethearchaeota archaeon]